jgi:Uncharacterised nucleotidyltransferase
LSAVSERAAQPGAAEGIWKAVDDLAARAERLSDLEAHRLETVVLCGAASAAVLAARREQALRTLGAPLVLERVREVASGTLLLVKGPELARRYPPPRLRPFGDVDLIVEDAERTQRELLAAGFREVGEAEKYLGIHHLRPVQWPGTLVAVEVHSHPKWPKHSTPVSFRQLTAAAVAAPLGVDGVSTLPPAEHAVLVALHGWAHEPLARLLDLLDVALLLQEADPGAADAVAAEWKVERIWSATARATDALFHGAPETGPLRTWASGLCEVRERTVWHSHLAEIGSPLEALGVWRGLPAAARALAGLVRRQGGEGWRTKLIRSARAVLNARRRRSDHAPPIGGDVAARRAR